MNKEGIQAFKLYIKGKPEIITIDTALPMKNQNTPLFSRPNEDGSWWIPLLEKGYAKLNGYYENLGLGWMAEAMKVLTGAPSYKYTNS